eukprot:jgi/Tetstr1/429716/TSEL_019611.t1
MAATWRRPRLRLAGDIGGQLRTEMVDRRSCPHTSGRRPGGRARWRGTGSAAAGSEAQWWRRHEELMGYKREHGDCLVPQRYKPNPALGKWVKMQRQLYKKGELKAERVEALEALRFDGDPLEAQWLRMYEQLVAYKKERGDCLALGFEWDPKEAEWQRMFAHLKAYRALTGHCLVPQSDGPLGVWVSTQRQAMTRGGMLPHRQRLLEDTGFVWKVRPSQGVRDNDKQWQEWLALLRTYKVQHGHCLVPKQHTEDGKKLGRWVSTQRVLWRKGRLAADRQEALQDVGVVWDPLEAEWQAMYEELCAFKERSGHCSVTPRDKEHKTLGMWADTQRRRYNKGRLVEARLAKLEALGFPWSLRMQ